jgi:transcriptional regulator with XRE-family HTH domain
MKRFSYGERDYAFGQAMLTLRTAIGLTQAGFAERLRVSRKAIGRWEGGFTYPKAEHLKALLAFAVGQQAFPSGREEEEVRAFWHVAHQKVSLDESWLQGLLGTQRPRLALVAQRPVEQTYGAEHDSAPPAGGEPQVDWGDALDVPSFYGREGEVARLSQWVIEERCRVVSIEGMGGIGKSALATRVMHQVAPHFEVVLWCFLRDAPACEAILDECLQVLAPSRWVSCRPPSNDASVS